MTRTENIRMLHHTLDILEKGAYRAALTPVKLKLSRKEMETATVFLPEELNDLSLGQGKCGDAEHLCAFGCENMDSFAMARKRLDEGAERVLVLNLANPVNPGGGVRKGSRAQEEDLCRKSSLLVSLEGRGAQRYYEYNRRRNTYMGSDAVIITPQVEVIRDENGKLMRRSAVVSVMTCAAPMLTYGMEGMTMAQYVDMVYTRVVGMLKVAAHCGYRSLVLGAFGCGAFQNDARIVSEIFYDAITEFNFCGLSADDLFDRVDFAVLDRTEEQYNFKSFHRHFGTDR